MTDPDDLTRTQVRIPNELYARLVEAAKAAGRSMNAELVHRLSLALQPQLDLPRDLLDRAGAAAAQSGRSLAAEIAHRLELAYATAATPDAKDLLIEWLFLRARRDELYRTMGEISALPEKDDVDLLALRTATSNFELHSRRLKEIEATPGFPGGPAKAT